MTDTLRDELILLKRERDQWRRDAIRLAKAGQVVADRHYAGWRNWENNPPRSTGRTIYRAMTAWEAAVAAHRKLAES